MCRLVAVTTVHAAPNVEAACTQPPASAGSQSVMPLTYLCAGGDCATDEGIGSSAAACYKWTPSEVTSVKDIKASWQMVAGPGIESISITTSVTYTHSSSESTTRRVQQTFTNSLSDSIGIELAETPFDIGVTERDTITLSSTASQLVATSATHTLTNELAKSTSVDITPIACPEGNLFQWVLWGTPYTEIGAPLGKFTFNSKSFVCLNATLEGGVPKMAEGEPLKPKCPPQACAWPPSKNCLCCSDKYWNSAANITEEQAKQLLAPPQGTCVDGSAAAAPDGGDGAPIQAPQLPADAQPNAEAVNAACTALGLRLDNMSLIMRANAVYQALFAAPTAVEPLAKCGAATAQMWSACAPSTWSHGYRSS